MNVMKYMLIKTAIFTMVILVMRKLYGRYQVTPR